MDVGVILGVVAAVAAGIFIFMRTSGASSSGGCGCGCCGTNETLEDEVYEENDEDRGCCDDDNEDE